MTKTLGSLALALTVAAAPAFATDASKTDKAPDKPATEAKQAPAEGTTDTKKSGEEAK